MERIKSRVPRDYPYTYARVSAKRAKLLGTDDYEKLLKMGANEIARNLEDGDYSTEIEELGNRHSGIQLLELALNRNLSNTMHKLVEIAEEPLRSEIEVYLKKYDVETVKRILRAKRNESDVDPGDLVNPVTIFNGESISEMKELNIEELVQRLDSDTANYTECVEFEGSISEIESGLDRAYSQELRALKSYSESRQFSKFVESEIEHENLMNALRLSKYGYASDAMQEMLPDRLSEVVEQVLRAQDIEEAVEVVSREMEVDAETLDELERELEKRRLRKALQMMHSEPLGATSILGYVVAKTAEVRNLRTLTRGKEAGMETVEIREELVLP